LGNRVKFDPVVLDHRIGQQLIAHLIEVLSRLPLTIGSELKFDVLADPDPPNGVIPEVMQSRFDRSSRWVEDGGTQRDVNASLIASHNSGSQQR
jgi:hypothetical protein